MMSYRLRNLLNEVSWQLKQIWRSSPSPRLPSSCAQLPRLVVEFNSSQASRYNELIERYETGTWCTVLNLAQWRENLYVLDVLDRYLADLPVASAGLEIGCRNFSYLPALHGFRHMSWLGVELDAHARYWNGVTRAAYGQTLANCFPDCRYHAGALREVSGNYDVIVWFLPFVFSETVIAYGLPDRFFNPRDLLTNAYDRLNPGGTMFIVNQEVNEYQEQRRLCDDAGLAYVAIGEIFSEFSPFYKARYAIRICKSR